MEAGVCPSVSHNWRCVDKRFNALTLVIDSLFPRNRNLEVRAVNQVTKSCAAYLQNTNTCSLNAYFVALGRAGRRLRVYCLKLLYCRSWTTFPAFTRMICLMLAVISYLFIIMSFPQGPQSWATGFRGRIPILPPTMSVCFLTLCLCPMAMLWGVAVTLCFRAKSWCNPLHEVLEGN